MPQSQTKRTPDNRLSLARVSWKSLTHYWRVNLAVVLGIAVGTAVLSGALVVGDSVTESLKRLTLERLGQIDQILIADHFFSEAIAAALHAPGESDGRQATPVVLLDRVSAETQSNENRRRAGQITVIGCDEAFWSLGTDTTRPARMPDRREVIINEPLATKLNARVGDRLVLRLPKTSQVAADSTLGRKSDLTRNLAELEIIEILPAAGLGRFTLEANQSLPRTAYLAREVLQNALEQVGQVNAVLIQGSQVGGPTPPAEAAQLRERIRPSLEDAGLRLKRVVADYQTGSSEQPTTAWSYFSVSNDRMVFSDEAAELILNSLSRYQVQPVATYLANEIRKSSDSGEGSSSIPYSTVSAVDPIDSLGPYELDSSVTLDKGQIVLNSWAAKDLNVDVGQTVELTYFEPETTHGTPLERTTKFEVVGLAPLVEPEQPFTRVRAARFASPPTHANDPDLTPEVPGITDQESIDDWDPPFPYDPGRIRHPTDEDYWDLYRTTPKAFISLDTGRELWQSRFGTTTSFRIVATEEDAVVIRQSIEAAIAKHLETFGFRVLQVKNEGLAASKGTTPFNVLFLGFSCFIVAAALMLVALLFRLNVDQRSDQAGLMLAMGIPRKGVSRQFLLEGLALSAVGAVLGGIAGMAYAELMLLGMRTWWLDAVVTPFLQTRVNLATVMTGIILGILVSLATIWLAVRGLRRYSARQLINGELESVELARPGRGRFRSVVVIGLIALAIVAAIAATRLHGEAQAGAFFGSGAMTLAALLTWISGAMRRRRSQGTLLTFRQFVTRNISRHPRRSALTIGLVASACFLIIAVSAFRLSPTEAGTGGFLLQATSELPLFDDLNSPDVREDRFGSAASQLRDLSVYPFRVKEGDDASCRNLYQARRPRFLGTTDQFLQSVAEGKHAFAWAAYATLNDAETSPWALVKRDPIDGHLPVVLDKNTAMYALHLYGGVGQRFELDYGDGQTVPCEVVGLLANSVLQGVLITGEANLLSVFPDLSGYRFFLMDLPPTSQDEVVSLLEDSYSDQGLQLESTSEVLSGLLAVQNTYLSTFQSLGGLGLLLGTFGLAAVQLRSVFERRGELALLQAVGFDRHNLRNLVLAEHITLLLAGLAIGSFAALIAVAPHALSTPTRPPVAALAGILATILVVGSVTGWITIRRVLRAPVIAALRGD